MIFSQVVSAASNGLVSDLMDNQKFVVFHFDVIWLILLNLWNSFVMYIGRKRNRGLL